MRAQRLAGLCCLSALLLLAQDWTATTTLPGVDFAGLTPAQRTIALKLLRHNNCPCGCGMMMAECRVKDPSCSYSKGTAAAIVAALHSGKNEREALAAGIASRWGQGPPDHNKPLEDPVKIPVDGMPARGPAAARVTLVEFSDFQCPFCITATPQIDALLKAYPSQVKLIFKEFPLDSHSQAALAARAALSAGKQGKFWDMHDAMFALKGNLSRERMLSIANVLKLDPKRFQTDLDSPEIKRAVEKEIAEGENIGVDSTPTLFVNGQRFNGPLTMAALKPIVDSELKRAGK